MSNLAFLYILAGNTLPGLFDDISQYVGSVIGGDLMDYQGFGLQDFEAQTDFDVMPDSDFGDTADDIDYQENVEDVQDYADGFNDEADDYNEEVTPVTPDMGFPAEEEPPSFFDQDRNIFGGNVDDDGDNINCDDIDCIGAACGFVESISSLMEDMEDDD